MDIDLSVRHVFSDEQVAKISEIPAGYTISKHKHSYSHLSVVLEGACIVSNDDRSTTHKAGDVINICAGMNHEIYAIEDTRWACIHVTKEKDPMKLDKVLIDKGPL